jgi:ribokinase
VTAGAEGVFVAAGARAERLPALAERPPAPAERLPAPAVEVRDTTGAGDTFSGVLAAGLARGWELERAARRAVAAAALSVTRPGARGGMPRESEIDAV